MLVSTITPTTIFDNKDMDFNLYKETYNTIINNKKYY